MLNCFTKAVPRGRLLWLVVALACMVGIHAYCYRPYFGIDDSNITQVYASNLVQGYGWAYHQGAERVEGTTSFLYTLIWAAAFLTPLPHLVMHCLNFCFCLIACWAALATLRLLRADGPDTSAPKGLDIGFLAYILWVALSPGALSWLTVTLMDASLWTAVVLLAVYFTAEFAQSGDPTRYARHMSPLCAVLLVTRPEALLLVPVFLLLAFGKSYAASHSLYQALRAIRAPGLTYFLVSGSMILVRLAYFGYPLPNTYYSKVSPDIVYSISNGVRYVISMSTVTPLMFPLLGVGLILLWRDVAVRWTKKQIGVRPLAVVVCSTVVLVGIAVVNGGDHFGQGRFLVQAVMLAPLPALALLPMRAAVPMGRVGVVAVSAAWVLTALVIDWRQLRSAEATQDLAHEFRIAEQGMQVGEILDRALPNESMPSLGAITAGGVARTYRGYVIDLLGTNNTLVAHSKGYRYGLKNHASFSPEAFYKLAPDFVFPCLITADLPDSTKCESVYAFDDYVTRSIRKEERFKGLYEEVELRVRNAAPVPYFATPRAFSWLAEPRWEKPFGVRVFVKKSLTPMLRLDFLELVRV